MFLDLQIIETWQSTLLGDCAAFLPELILCGTIVLLLLLRLFRGASDWHLGWETLTLTVVALIVSGLQWRQNMHGYRELFGGLIVYDSFTIFLRMFLFGFTALVIWLSLLTGIPDKEDSADFYVLLLGATVGMSLMASANHLLMVFIGVEMASLPSYALAGFLKGRRRSSEASLKYVVYGGGASGVMLYGISLIAGKFGTGYLPDLGKVIPLVSAAGFDPILLLGTLFIVIGVSFKLAAVPFQFWCPDVFEGAAAEVAGYLSVASKGAALAMLARITMAFYLPGESISVGALVLYLVPTLALLATLTATFGNLAAYPQNNLKRLLAYSTIAHAGYMLMGLATLTREGVSAVLVYLVAYLFMNLGAFAVIAILRNLTGSEDVSGYRGLIYRSPVLVITLGVFLLSLLGLPPLAGFAAKFQIFQALYHAGNDYASAQSPFLAKIMYGLVVVLGINTVFSAFYYLRVLKIMVIDKPIEEVEGRPTPQLPVPIGSAVYASLLAVMILVIGVAWNPLAVASDRGVDRWLPPKSSPSVAAASAEDRR